MDKKLYKLLRTPNCCFLDISQRLASFATREEITTFVFNYFSGYTFVEYTRVLLELWAPTLEEARSILIRLSDDFPDHRGGIKSLVTEYLRVKEKDLSDFLAAKDGRTLEDIFSGTDPNNATQLLTPLEISLLYDFPKMFHFLLQLGANPNIYNVFPPLFCAFAQMEDFDADYFFIRGLYRTNEQARQARDEEMNIIADYIREMLIAGADPEVGGRYDRLNYHPLKVALGYNGESFFATIMLQFQLGGVGNLDSLVKSYFKNKSCIAISEHYLDSIQTLFDYGIRYSSQDLVRIITFFGQSFQEATPPLAQCLDIPRLLLEISPLEIERVRAFVPLFLMEEYDETISQIKKIALPRAVKIIRLHLTEGCYRPGGPGFYAAMQRFNALSASRCDVPVSN